MKRYCADAWEKFVSRRTVHAETSSLDSSASEGPESSHQSSVLGIDTSPDGLRQPCLQHDHFSKEWLNLSQQDTFDGLRIEASKPMTKNMQATQTLILGSQQEPYQYQFGPLFQSASGRTFLLGKASLDGLLNARIVQKFFGPHMDLRVNAASCVKDPHRNMCEISKELNFAKWTTASKLVWQGIWIGNFGFSRMMSQNLHLGGELTYLKLGHGATIGTLAMRYSNGENTLNASLNRAPDFKNPMAVAPLNTLRLNFLRRVTERVSLGAEFEYTAPHDESIMKAGYEYTFRTSRVQGLLDTQGRVSCFVNDFKGFGFSGMIDYPNNDYKFGALLHYQAAGGEEGEGEPLLM